MSDRAESRSDARPGAKRPGRHRLVIGWLALLASVAGLRAQGTVAPDPIVELPPFEVVESVHEPWRYAAVPGIEVLSDCSDSTTRDFVRSYDRLLQMLHAMLPAEFQVKMAVPRLIILSSQKSATTISRELVPGAARAETPQARRPQMPQMNPIDSEKNVRFLPNLALNDWDIYADFAIVDDVNFEGATMGLTPSYVRFQLERRTPALPAWFVEGFVDLWSTAEFTESDTIVLGGAKWVSRAEEHSLEGDPDYPRTLLPLADLFANGPADVAPDPLRWRAEAALFVRWALENREGTSTAAFWKFLSRASTEPVTDASFRACFGFGLAAMRDRLSDYLPAALASDFRLGPVKLSRAPALSPHPATEGEIGRVKGDWERLEIAYVKERHPEYVQKYADQAKRTLQHAYERGERDPGFLAVLGLYWCDTGDDAAALPLLENAARAKTVVRPRAYVELARIRYAQVGAKPAGRAGLLSAEQANTVLAPLTLGHAQLPPLPDTYLLAAKVWNHSDVPLRREQFALLAEGLKFFPDNLGLLEQVAVLEALHGLKAEAAALVERGLRLSPSAAGKARLELLAAKLASANEAPGSNVQDAKMP